MRSLKFNEAVREATDQAMALDERVYLIGLGVPDPKGVFGTTSGLLTKHGTKRVFDMPTSENAMTGIAIGSAIAGMKPIMTHQRADFMLLAMDQLVNNAAKWRYMFAEQMTVPLVIRLVIGRGWGQGPQHAQTFHSFFAHISGIKVLAPSNPYDAKGLLLSAIDDPDPVVYLEHRWLHNIFGEVPEDNYRVPIGKAKLLQEGSDITIVASSHMTLEAWRATQILSTEGIKIDLVDLRSLRPLDDELILNSVRKTGRLLVLDADWKTAGLAAEIIALVSEQVLGDLKCAPQRVTYPDSMTPTSWTLSNFYYPTSKDVAIAALKMMNRLEKADLLEKEILEQRLREPMDTPDSSFTGPF